MELTKICIKCEIEKSLEDFYKHNGQKDNREGICKACRKVRDKIKTDRRSRAKNFW